MANVKRKHNMAGVEDPLDRAIRLMGGVAKLARALGINQPAVSQWRSGHRQIPVLRCIQIEHMTNGQVTREALRPDLPWPPARSDR